MPTSRKRNDARRASAVYTALACETLEIRRHLAVHPALLTAHRARLSPVATHASIKPADQQTPVVTVSDLGGIFSGSSFPATALVNGTSTLEGVSPTLSYYAGSYTDPSQLNGVTPLPDPGGPIYSGSYTVLANFPGSTDYSAAAAIATFEISKAPINLTVSAAGGAYTGRPLAATALVDGLSSLEGVTPTLQYYSGTETLAQTQGLTPLTGAAAAPGTYTVVAGFAGSTDYQAAATIAPITVYSTEFGPADGGASGWANADSPSAALLTSASPGSGAILSMPGDGSPASPDYSDFVNSASATTVPTGDSLVITVSMQTAISGIIGSSANPQAGVEVIDSAGNIVAAFYSQYDSQGLPSLVASDGNDGELAVPNFAPAPDGQIGTYTLTVNYSSNTYTVAYAGQTYTGQLFSSDSNSNQLTGVSLAGLDQGIAGSAQFDHFSETLEQANTSPAALKNFTITPAGPTLTVPSPQTITQGTAGETLSGVISAGTGVYPPDTEFVAATLNGTTVDAPINSQGQFSATFSTASLPVSGASNPVTFSYAGDTDFNAAAASTSLTVVARPAWLGVGSDAVWNSTTKVLTVTGPSSITADPGASEPLVQAIGSGAVLTIDPASATDIHLGGLSLTAGATANVSSLGSTRSLTDYHLLVLGTPDATAAPMFTIDSTSTLDLADNDLAILYGAGISPLPQVQEDLQTGSNYNPLTGVFQWNGTGLISSVAPTTGGATGLGYAEDSELSAISQAEGGSAIGTFDGQTLGANAVLVKYTLMGDSSLSGTVSGADYNTVLANYDTNGDWSQGNFHYAGTYAGGTFTNGQANGQDYNIVLNNYDESLVNFLPGGAGRIPSRLAFTQIPAETVASADPIATPVLLQVEDASGNPIGAYADNISLTVSGPGLPAGGESVTPALFNGVASFDLSTITDLNPKAAGTYTLTASDPTDSLHSISNTFTIDPGAATQLAISPIADMVDGGTVLSAGQPVTVQIEDQYGNIVTGGNNTVAVSLVGAAGQTLGGTTTLHAYHGVASFSDLSVAGSSGAANQLRFTDDGDSLAESTNTFQVSDASQQPDPANLINLDFTAGNPVQSGAALIGSAHDQWNDIASPDDALNQPPLAASNLPLFDSGGVSTGVTVSYGNATFAMQQTDPSFGSTPYANLMNGGLIARTPANGGDGTALLTLSNLNPDSTYTIYLYTANNAIFTVNGQQATTMADSSSTFQPNDNYVTFTTQPVDGNINITFAATSDSSDAVLNGIQLLQSPALPAWLSATSAATWNATSHVLTVTGPTQFTADPGTDQPIVQASGSAAVLTFDPTTGTDIHLGGLSLTAGATANVSSLGSARSLSDHHLLVLGTPDATAAPLFTIDSTSTLDLADNDLAILYGTGTSPLSQVQEDLQTGSNYNPLTGVFQWNGTGLISSVAPTTGGATGLGYAEDSELSAISQAEGGSAIGTFDGQTLGANAVLVKYTLMGDSSLSGTVSGADYNTVLANYDTDGDWSQGNFHYAGTYAGGTFTNGQANGQDYNIVLANYDNSLSTYLPGGAGTPSAMPAPVTPPAEVSASHQNPSTIQTTPLPAIAVGKTVIASKIGNKRGSAKVVAAVGKPTAASSAKTTTLSDGHNSKKVTHSRSSGSTVSATNTRTKKQ